MERILCLDPNVWDVVGGRLIVCLTEGGSTSVTYSRDGKYTASSRLVDGRVSVWVWNAVILGLGSVSYIAYKVNLISEKP